MNPAFGIIIIILCFVLWVVLRRIFTPVGRKVGKIGKEIHEEITKEETWNEKEKSADSWAFDMNMITAKDHIELRILKDWWDAEYKEERDD